MLFSYHTSQWNFYKNSKILSIVGGRSCDQLYYYFIYSLIWIVLLACVRSNLFFSPLTSSLFFTSHLYVKQTFSFAAPAFLLLPSLTLLLLSTLFFSLSFTHSIINWTLKWDTLSIIKPWKVLWEALWMPLFKAMWAFMEV